MSALVVLAAMVGLAQAAGPRVPADIVLVNGEILTMDDGTPQATALAIRGPDIVQVGGDREVRRWVGPKTRVLDLEGRTVVPGLIDGHVHAIRAGQTFLVETYWYGQTRLGEALQALKDAAARRGAGEWVAVVGAWHPAQFVEKRGPTKAELDAALPGNPAYVQLLYDHALVNQRGIDVLELDAGGQVPVGLTVERDAAGRATGKISGGISGLSALFARVSRQPEATRQESLRRFFLELNRLGVTAVVDAAAGDFAMFNPLFALWREQRMTVRVGYRASVLVRDNEEPWYRTALTYLPPRFGDDHLRFVGMGESLVSGMNDGVRQAPGFSPTEAARSSLLKVLTLAAERGYSVELHAYTDDAANQILDVFEVVGKTRSIESLRWSIAHINTGKPATFERMQRLGVAYAVQMGPYFEADAIEAANDRGTAEASPPVCDALNAGVRVVGGTDGSRAGEVNVWRAIEFQVTGRAVGDLVQRSEVKRLSRLEALRLYTVNGAWLTFDEARRGSLRPGKLADLAVLSAPYLRMSEDEIHRLHAVLTIVGGQIVHQSTPSSARPKVRGAVGASRGRQG